MSNTLLNDLSDVLGFVLNNDGEFFSPVCEVRESAYGGLGVFAKQDLGKDQTLLKLKKSSIFSASNSSIANLLVDDDLDGILALNIAFVYETTVFKEKSHWYPYLKSIRICDCNGKFLLPPNYWNQAEKSLLKGLTLDTLHDGLTPEGEVQEGFEMAIDLANKWNREFGLEIPSEYFQVDQTNEEEVRSKYLRFIATAYAISSRVFEIDAYHQSALVPIADLFNHNVIDPDVHFGSLYDVCELCGEPGMCKHLIAEAAMEEAASSVPPQDTQHNKHIVDENLLEELNANTDDSSDETSGDDLSDHNEFDSASDECVDIILVNDVECGEEVFNSYGEMSNALLLARYGFCVKGNPTDVVHLGKEIMKLVKHNKRYSQKVSWWSEVGYELYSNWYNLKRKPEDSNDEGFEDDDDGDDDEEEHVTEEESLTPWLSEMCIDFEGQPFNTLTAFLNLLSMSKKRWETFHKATKDNIIANASHIQILGEKGDQDAWKLLMQLVASKENVLLSHQQSIMHTKDINQDRLRNITILLGAEIDILKSLKNRHLLK